MPRSAFLPGFPAEWKLVVEPYVPTGGEDRYADRLRLDRGEEPPWYFSGLAYRATEPDETPTHYPTVRNRRGGLGFVLLTSEAPAGSVSSNRSRCGPSSS